MKKQNKNYLSLADQGITKAWDKAVIFKDKITGKMQIVFYYANKPFYYWPVNDAFNVAELKNKLYVTLYLYNTSTLNERKIKKWLARYFVRYDAGERVVTYRRGGVLFPSTEVV